MGRSELVPLNENAKRAAVLADNTFGIMVDEDLTEEERKDRLIALIPVALEIEQEARATIQRLNEEIERLTNANGQANHQLP
jgi:hypothetical protein